MNRHDEIGVEQVEAAPEKKKKKNGSQFNALKYGHWAQTAVLPGEDLLAFQERVGVYLDVLRPRDLLEADIAQRGAIASWKHDRAIAAAQGTG